jgi:hypothetical protein
MAVRARQKRAGKAAAHRILTGPASPVVAEVAEVEAATGERAAMSVPRGRTVVIAAGAGSGDPSAMRSGVRGDRRNFAAAAGAAARKTISISNPDGQAPR